MISNFFDRVTRLSIRFRWVTIAITIIILVLGIFAMTDLNLELTPRIEFPQTVVVIQWPDSESSDQFLNEVTIPLEEKFSTIEGVVNVESNTNTGFAFFIVRNDFGMNQDKIVESLEAAVADAGLPEGVEDPQVLNFSLSDLPVVVASVSSADLTLPELKELVEAELQPLLEGVEQVSRVTTGGGQELPEEVVVEESPAGEAETTEEVVTEDPGRLPLIVIQGAKQFGVDVEYAQDVTPDVLAGITGTAEQVMAVLNLIPAETLPFAPPETLSLLPIEYLEQFDEELLAELDDLAADYGGIGQYNLEQVVRIMAGEDPEAVLMAEATAEPEPTAEPVMEDVLPTPEPVVEEETAELPQVEPVALPETWIIAASAAGFSLESTADITQEVMEAITNFAPQLLGEVTPEMWRALDPAMVAEVLPSLADTLDPALLLELQAIQLAANGIAPEPVTLPESWVTAAGAAGFSLETTADVPAEAMGQLAGFAPQLLDDLTPDVLLAFSPEVLAELPESYVTELDEGMQQTLTNIGIHAARHEAMAVEVVEAIDLPQIPPVPLPETWIEGAAALGQTIADTSDIIPEFAEGILNFAPELLGEVTPEMWRALDPAVVAILLPEVADSLDPDLFLQLQAIQMAANNIAPEAVDLPESWITTAGAAGFTLETTADIPAEAIGQLAGFAPQLLDDLTPDILLAFSPEVLVQLPESYVKSLDEGLQQTLANISIIKEQQMAAVSGGEEVVAEPEVDPARLPDLLIQGAKAAGFEIEFAQDIEPDFVRAIASFGPQATQFLAALTPDNLRLMQPESIALLPADFLETLDPELLAELDEIAAEYGGAGQLAIEEAKAADPARLPEVLIQGAKSFGVDIEYAQDITPDFIRPLASAGPQAAQLFALLTPDHLRLLQPEVIALLPADFLDTLDADLRAELDELAAEYGGAGQMAIEEAEAAAAASADSPPLSGIWLEPGPDGSESLFKTAGDILNNPFVPGAAALLNFFPDSPNVENPADWMGALSPDVIQYLAENEEGFVENLSPTILELMSPETLTFMLENYPDAFDAELTQRLSGIAAGTLEVFVPEASITRTDGNPAVIVSLYKDGDANTVEVAHRIFDQLDAFKADNPDIETNLVFEQATFIEDSIAGVAREGALGAVFAVVVILLFLSGHVGGKYKLSWRATLVTGTSIPLSVFAAFFFMRWMPSTVGVWMEGLVESSGNDLLAFISRLFPTNVTLNIMTLSGMTVAIGRVVDDSIVVLENSYRFIQRGDDPKKAVIEGTKEVAIAIFSATATTVAVFLPLGLVGGIIGSFFLPFGLTVTYALAASFIVSITVVPALTYMLIRREHIPEERETTMQRWYTPILVWVLNNRIVTLVIAFVIFLSSLFLLTRLPQSFIPSIGEPTINVNVNLPNGTTMVDTNDLVEEMESILQSIEGIERVQTEIGSGGGFESFFGGGGVSQNVAVVTVSPENHDELASLTNEIRSEAEAVFGVDNVTVSAASQTGFGGFSMVVTGESLEQLQGVVDDVKEAIGAIDVDGDGIPDIANISSNLDGGTGPAGGQDLIIRIDGRPAVSFSGELETDNTLGVTTEAKQAIIDSGLPAGVEVTEGFESEQQVEGFKGMVRAIGYSIVIVYLIMALTFRSLINPFIILFSLPFALVGAVLALFISNSVLGISAMIGLMMLVGIVVTNGIVLMELVQQLRKRGRNAYDALVQGGRTRLRPIWMTALAAILALIPLGLSQEAGAVIASELALVVMGGLLVSTALTLLVIPAGYSLVDSILDFLRRMLRRSNG